MAILEGEDRIQAETLLETYRRRLRIRERQMAHYGESADPSIETDAKHARTQVQALERILAPPLDDAVVDLVKRRLEDDVLLFVQGEQLNARMTVAEEGLSTLNKVQSAASLWRIDKGAIIEDLQARILGIEGKRKWGQWRNTVLQMAILIMLIALFLMRL